MSTNISFSKDNLDDCLRHLGKEFRRRNGKNIPAEIVLVGGASIIINYGFREATYDVDAIIKASSVMKEAINSVGDSIGLPNGWLNSDFKMTNSYSPRLSQYSKYYKTFSNILTVRTITGEYLVAMKLMSCRQYKNDISDIIGILKEQSDSGQPLTFEDINKAVNNLYDTWDNLPSEAKPLIETILNNDNLEELYFQYRENENTVKNILIEFNEDYPGVVKEDNITNIIAILKSKK